MNGAQRLVRRIDRFQQGHPPTAVAVGVVKKFGDDRAGSLAALVAYYGFLSLFPLLLLLFTVLGMVAGGDPRLVDDLRHSVLSQFPVVGSTVGANVRALHRDSVVGLTVGIVGLLWASQGAMNAAQYAMAEVWGVPESARPNFLTRLLRTYAMLGLLGAFLVLSTGASALAGTLHVTGVARAAALAFSLVVNVGLYLVAFRGLTPEKVAPRALLAGALVGGAGWTVLQFLGSFYLGHELRHSEPVYGFFGVVLCLLAWIYLGAELSLYAAEVSVVWQRHLWPRSMVEPPFTDAGRRALRGVTDKDLRRHERRVVVGLEEAPGRSAGSPRLGAREGGPVPGPERSRAAAGEK